MLTGDLWQCVSPHSEVPAGGVGSVYLCVCVCVCVCCNSVIPFCSACSGCATLQQDNLLPSLSGSISFSGSINEMKKQRI